MSLATRRATLLAAAFLAALFLAAAALAAAPLPPHRAAMVQDARERFERWLDPPLVQRLPLDLLAREAGRPVRELLRRRHDEALQALAGLDKAADAAATADEVDDALRHFAGGGASALAEALFARQPAAARHRMALTELPAALWPLANPNGIDAGALAVQRGNRFGHAAGAQAVPLLREAVARDPGDAGAWLALLWLAGDTPTPATLQQVQAARGAILASGDEAAAVAAELRLAALWRAAPAGGRDGNAAQTAGSGGTTDQAAAALQRALDRIDDAIARRAPGAGERDRAFALGQVGALQAARGDATGAAAAWQHSLALREALAAAAPDDVEAQLDVAAAHLALARLPGGEPRHLATALAIYGRAADRDRYTPMMDREGYAGLAAVVVGFGGLLTLGGALLLLALYRRRVAHWMQRAAAAPAAAPAGAAAAAQALHAVPAPAPAAPAPLVLQTLSAAPAASGPAAADPRLPASAVQLAAGAAFAAVATALTVHFQRLAPTPLRLALIFWSLLLPVVVVLWLAWAGDRRRRAQVLAGYAGGLALLCLRAAASETPPLRLAGVALPALLQPLLYWLIDAGPSLFLVLCLNRRVRSIGPVLLTIVLCAGLGGALAQVASSSLAGIQLLARTSGALGSPPFLLLQAGVFLGGALLLMPLAAALLLALRAAEDRGWINDQTLVIDTLWLFPTAMLCLAIAQEAGPAAPAGLLAFAAHKAVALAGGAWLRRRARARPPRRLLLLRVFGDRRRSERFFDHLVASWAWRGPLRLIAAPDLASSTLGPGEFADFVSGRLRRRFVIEPADLQRRLAALRGDPDVDGRYRVDELFCGNDTWQPAVRALMRDSDLVVMDLRGFDAGRLGCRYELGALLDAVPASRFVLMVDASSDLALLEATLQAHARQLDPASPNAGAALQVTLLDAAAGDAAAVGALLQRAGDAAVS